jgi:hypothetical protein
MARFSETALSGKLDLSRPGRAVGVDRDRRANKSGTFCVYIV